VARVSPVSALQQLLLLPLLSPLLAVLLLAAVNPRPAVALRVLVWTTPAWPLGAWIAAAAASGAALSGTATALALRQGSQSTGPGSGAAPQSEPAAGPHSQRRRRRPMQQEPQRGPTTAGPSRSAGEPPPTVEVPFRVIRKARAQTPEPTTAQASSSEARVVGDGWDQPLNDDWS
jgi:hypothetical protein